MIKCQPDIIIKINMNKINMKKIRITIEHELTPFHEESLNSTVEGVIESIRRFWTEKSRKEFNIKVEYTK